MCLNFHELRNKYPAYITLPLWAGAQDTTPSPTTAKATLTLWRRCKQPTNDNATYDH